MKKKILVISSYPEKAVIHGKKTVGVASYTKNLLTNIKGFDIEVLAEIHDKKEKYKEKDILINRFWKRGSIKSLIQLTSYVLKSQKKTILVALEFYMFGGLLENIIFLFSLLIWKLAGKKIVLILHQVVMSLTLIYWPLIFLSDKLVVFEEKFKKALNNDKVMFIPHAVEKIKFKIKKKVNNQKKFFSALFFGFISPYKGVKQLLEFWDNKYGKLVVAGGGNPNHMKNKKYCDFVKSIKSTGFIPQNKISDYFLKTDLVVLPYKKFFSSSGPLSLAFSFEKPFILSRPLEGYFDSFDFKEALKETGLKPQNFLFDLNKKSFAVRLNWAKKNLDKLSTFSRIMKEKRSWEKVAKQYEDLLK